MGCSMYVHGLLVFVCLVSQCQAVFRILAVKEGSSLDMNCTYSQVAENIRYVDVRVPAQGQMFDRNCTCFIEHQSGQESLSVSVDSIYFTLYTDNANAPLVYPVSAWPFSGSYRLSFEIMSSSEDYDFMSINNEPVYFTDYENNQDLYVRFNVLVNQSRPTSLYGNGK